ncbi:hypothetical protein NDU88_002658 [Pleurodeles waltl]|uniref:Uncharacterized protein n=1 Tax=Pleurodeles waltl TaxID=8319 RepID=A0AAV7NEN0_PLEWA|nr:hypothetical protein NDU88_002658 [Pleurodeles waltl]
MKDVHCDTNESEVLSDIILTSDGKENPDDIFSLDEYVLDLDLEDPYGEDFPMEADVPSTSDNVIRGNLGGDPWNGMERSLKSYQDRLLAIVRPLARIMDMVEEAHTNDLSIDIDLLR